MIGVMIAQCVLFLLCLLAILKLMAMCVHDRDKMQETLEKAVALMEKFDKKIEDENELLEFIEYQQRQEQEEERKKKIIKGNK